MKRKYEPRLVAYINVGILNDTQHSELVADWDERLQNHGLDARCENGGRGNGFRDIAAKLSAIVAIRFYGGDIDEVAKCLDMTASDILFREVSLGMGE